MADDAARIAQLEAENAALRQLETGLTAENLAQRDQINLLTAVRDESLEQQIATADILRAIATNPTGLQGVLNGLVSSAVRLLDVDGAGISQPVDSRMQVIAEAEPERLSHEHRERLDRASRVRVPGQLSRASIRGRAFLEGRTVEHIQYDWSIPAEYPDMNVATAIGPSASLCTPLLREGRPIGTIIVIRLRPEPFTARQIALLETFADQAVIAIENARLFEELEQRNAELQESNRQVTEALEQQTATAEILSVIARSQSALQPVFEAISQRAYRLCHASSANLARASFTHSVTIGANRRF